MYIQMLTSDCISRKKMEAEVQPDVLQEIKYKYI